MSLHKLTAGSGYDYLTRQVAAMDATDKGHAGLASYYTEKGETPGVWVGSGMEGIDGLDAGDVVTADHMQNLFGAGHHPLATAAHQGAGPAGRSRRRRQPDRGRLQGRRSARHPVQGLRERRQRLPGRGRQAPRGRQRGRRTAGRLAGPRAGAGHGSAPRSARDFFRAEHGREPADARELAATIAKHSRPKTNAVAGYDLTFSPVKSVSALWALADPKTAAVIERAHQAAIKDALDFIETKALFTRQGTNGVRQVNVRGLVATAFTHRDSRAGDPDLHTHVAVANKVQTLDGEVAGDRRPAALQGQGLGLGDLQHRARAAPGRRPRGAVRGAPEPSDARKRPVREIVGVDPDLNHRFSKRRASVEARRKDLAAAVPGDPRPPADTGRDAAAGPAGHAGDPRGQARAPLAGRAARGLEPRGGRGPRLTAQRLKQMLHGALNPTAAGDRPGRPTRRGSPRPADRIVATMEGGRATWQYWHVYAEAQRQVRAARRAHRPGHHRRRPAGQRGPRRPLGQHHPPLRRRSPSRPSCAELDGASVYTVGGVHLFTSSKVLAAEERLVEAAGRRDGYAVDEQSVALALLESERQRGHPQRRPGHLGPGDGHLRRPAAAGDRARRVGQDHRDAGARPGLDRRRRHRDRPRPLGRGRGRAEVSMGSQIDTQTDTLAKLTHSLEQPGDRRRVPDWVAGIGPQTLVVIDEAGMADTLSLDIAVQHVLERGGSVRLVGDDQQLAAIGAGGVLRDIRATHGALQLTELVRFTDPAEGAASLALREGKSEALGFYLDRDRVHVGDLATMTEDVFAAWQADRAAGLDSIMLAPTRDLVSELNQQARAHRLEGADPADAAVGPARRLADGNEASDRRADHHPRQRPPAAHLGHRLGQERRPVDRPGHPRRRRPDRAAHPARPHRPPPRRVRRDLHRARLRLHRAHRPGRHRRHHARPGHRHRVAPAALHDADPRQRGNHVYLEVVGDGDPHSVIHPTLVRPLTPTDILESMLARDDAQRSATSLMREQADPATRLGEAAQRYLDSLYVAAEDLRRQRRSRCRRGPGQHRRPAAPRPGR